MNPVTNTIFTIGKNTLRRAATERPKPGEVAIGLRAGIGRTLVSGPVADKYKSALNRAIAAGEQGPVDKNPAFAEAYKQLNRVIVGISHMFETAAKRQLK